MSTSPIDLIGSRLSGEVILICDDQMIVREANELARTTLSEHIVGRPLLRIVTAMARSKGKAFIDALGRLDDTAVTNTWELLLHVPRAAPLLVSLRGGRLPEGGWMIMGSSDSPRLTALYHEVLSINTELTNVIRQLTREQAALVSSINQLIESQRAPHDADRS
jgi:hypothetical protein